MEKTNQEQIGELCGLLLRVIDLLTDIVNSGKSVQSKNSDGVEGSVFSEGELTDKLDNDENGDSVGVIVVSDGKILTGKRLGDFGNGEICGPGGHIESEETPEQAAIRETREEFGITPTELIFVGVGKAESDTGLQPHIFLCTEYDGEIKCADGEMAEPQFLSIDEIQQSENDIFKPFADSVAMLIYELLQETMPLEADGGPMSGNRGHEGVPGQVGGSAPSGKTLTSEMKKIWASEEDDEISSGVRKVLDKMAIGQSYEFNGLKTTKIAKDKVESETPFVGEKYISSIESAAESLCDMCFESECEPPKILDVSSEQIAEKMIENQELKPSETSVKTVISTIKSQNDLRSLSDDERKKLVDEIDSENPKWGLEHNGSLANEISARLDLNKPPTMLGEKEFEQYVSQNNCVRIWRGVQDQLSPEDESVAKSVNAIEKEFMYGTSKEANYGGGNFGSGYHFSTDKHYATGFGKSTEFVNGTVFNCALKNDAKIIDFETAKSESEKFSQKFGLRDVEYSAWALLNGYDAIYSSTGVYNILNRNSLVMKK